MPDSRTATTQPSSPRATAADLLTAVRLPLALVFVLVPHAGWRVVVLATAAVTDLLDGVLARRVGSSRLGAFLDPVADKIFMAAAFAVVLVSGRLHPLEIVAVLARDLAASLAFLVTWLAGRPASIPARLGGKAVTVAQLATLLAFLAESPYLRPMAWATAGIALYAIGDYARAAREARALGSRSTPGGT